MASLERFEYSPVGIDSSGSWRQERIRSRAPEFRRSETELSITGYATWISSKWLLSSSWDLQPQGSSGP